MLQPQQEAVLGWAAGENPICGADSPGFKPYCLLRLGSSDISSLSLNFFISKMERIIFKSRDECGS